MTTLGRYENGTTDDDYFIGFRPANLTVGEGSNTQKQVDVEDLVNNLKDLFNLMGCRTIWGPYLVNNSSTPTECHVYVENARGHRGIIDAGDYVQISDGTNEFSFTATNNDRLDFDVTDMGNAGSGPADFSDAGFRAALYGVVYKRPFKFGYESLITTGAHASKITGTRIAVADGTSTTIDEMLVSHNEKIINVITGDGTNATIADNAVTAGAIKKSGDGAAFENDSPVNIAKDGSCSKFYGTPDDPHIAFGLLATSPAASDYWKETTINDGHYSVQGFSTAAGGVGILVEFKSSEIFPTPAMASRKVTITCRAYSTVADNIQLGFYDDITAGNYQVEDITIAANTWTTISATVTLPAGIIALYGVFRSKDATATSLYCVDFNLLFGETAFVYTPSPYAMIVHNAMRYAPGFNFIPMADFDYSTLAGAYFGYGGSWLEGASAAPTGWTRNAGVAGTIALYTTDITNGKGAINWHAINGEFLYHQVGLVADSDLLNEIDQSNGALTFTVYIKTTGSNGNELEIGFFNNTTPIETITVLVSDYTGWIPVYITVPIVELVSDLKLGFKNSSGSDCDVYISAPILSNTAYPVAFTSHSIWRRDKARFWGRAGNLTDAELYPFGDITADGKLLITEKVFLYGISLLRPNAALSSETAYPVLYTATAAGTWGAGANQTQMTATLASAALTGHAGLDNNNMPVQLQMGHGLAIYYNADGVAMGANVSALAHLLRWGN